MSVFPRLHCRFSLKTALLIVTVACLVLAAVGWLYRQMTPAGMFARATGLKWPPSAEIVEQHQYTSLFTDPGVAESSHTIVFDVAPSTLNDWLAESPPWNAREWQYGETPDEIRLIVRLEEVWYVARDQSHGLNGALVAFDPGSGRVWFYTWDF
jgi:hypothetical protein